MAHTHDEEMEILDVFGAFDESYVMEILDAVRPRAPKTREAFRALCRLDLNAGCAAEVAEAERRLFDVA